MVEARTVASNAVNPFHEGGNAHQLPGLIVSVASACPHLLQGLGYFKGSCGLACDRKSVFCFGRNRNTAPEKLQKQNILQIIRFRPKLPNIRFRPNIRQNNSAENRTFGRRFCQITQFSAEYSVFRPKIPVSAKNRIFWFLHFLVGSVRPKFLAEIVPKRGSVVHYI